MFTQIIFLCPQKLKQKVYIYIMKHILAHIYFNPFFLYFKNIFKYEKLPYGFDQKRKKNLNIFFYVSQKTEIKSFGKIGV